MNVFLSWSGTLSHAVAESLSSWLPQVIHAVRPWLSSQDIEKGSRWFEEIGESLSTTDFGILCLTLENITAPWILFEAGALSKTLGQSRVCPLLIDLRNSDLQGPLAQFNTAGLAQGEIRKLVDSLNSRVPTESRRSETQLNEAFIVWWPLLEQRVSAALSSHRAGDAARRAKPQRNTVEVLDELLELTRSTAQQVSALSTLADAQRRAELDRRRKAAEPEAQTIREMMSRPKKVLYAKKPDSE